MKKPSVSSEDCLRDARAAMSTAIRELASAYTFTYRAGNHSTAERIDKIAEQVQALREEIER